MDVKKLQAGCSDPGVRGSDCDKKYLFVLMQTSFFDQKINSASAVHSIGGRLC